jgi:putative cardiolipin synthase
MHDIFTRCALALTTRAGRAGALVGAGLAGAAAAAWARAVMLMIAVALGGCASLPGNVGRPVTSVPVDVARTTLARMAAATIPAVQPDLSAIRLLPQGEEAFQTRLALIRRAEKTLDIQYYLIANDRTGLEFLGAVRDAAVRGVQVRILVDDLYATGEDALYEQMAAMQDVSVRMFNPLPVRGESFVARIALSLRELPRINHRMHNKLLVADGSFAVVGGRNIADEYFDRAGGAANFIDMDVLVTGRVVADLQRAFVDFWDSPHSYPLQDLVLSAAVQSTVSFFANETPGSNAPIEPEWFAAQAGMAPATVTLLADKPTKVDDSVGAVAEGHLALLDEARSEVILSSPYLVLGDRARTVLRGDLARDIRVSILTNSLATTDEPIVHLGYARHRADLVAGGISLSELMPGEQSADDARAGTRFARRSDSAGRLHGKLAVIDASTAFVGSMNLDRRSDRCNTEYGIVIRSATLAQSVRDFLVRQIDDRSYGVHLEAATGGLRWVDARRAAGPSRSDEPERESPLGLGTRLVAHLVGEDML